MSVSVGVLSVSIAIAPGLECRKRISEGSFGKEESFEL